MEKVILLLICSIFISACSTTKYVYKVPSFEMPTRPILRDNDIEDSRQIRNVELNYLDVIEYSLKLENILLEVKQQSRN